MKTCLKCGQCKPFSDFSKDKSNKNGLRSQCKTCCTQNHKRWREQNREYDKQWRKENRQANREASKRWYKNNIELARERDKYRKQSNPEKYNAYNAKYRGAKLQRTPQWLTKDQLDEIETFYTAALAFRIYTGLTYHVDHIVPLQGKNVCGLHVPWNLQVISATDNLKKSNLFED